MLPAIVIYRGAYNRLHPESKDTSHGSALQLYSLHIHNPLFVSLHSKTNNKGINWGIILSL